MWSDWCGKRRRLGSVVIAGQRQHAAVPAGARCIGVLEHIPASIHSGALAVPHGKYPVVLRALEHVDLLRAPDAGGGKVFVQPRLELHVMPFEMLLRFPRGLVDAAERRAAVAADESGGVQPGEQVALPLQHRQSDQCLRAAHVGAAAVQGPLVVEGDLRQRAADGFGKGRVHQDSCQKSCSWERGSRVGAPVPCSRSVPCERARRGSAVSGIESGGERSTDAAPAQSCDRGGVTRGRARCARYAAGRFSTGIVHAALTDNRCRLRVHAAAAATTLDLKGLGAPAEACTDFDEYVNGQWRKATPIPPDRARIGSFDTLRDESRDIVEQALIDAARNPSQLDTPGKLLAFRFYVSGMDVEAIEKRRLESLQPLLRADRCAQRPQAAAGVAGASCRATPSTRHCGSR